jgi:hypothetical protein
MRTLSMSHFAIKVSARLQIYKQVILIAPPNMFSEPLQPLILFLQKFCCQRAMIVTQ